MVRGGLAFVAVAAVLSISLLGLGLLRTQDELSETRTSLGSTRDDLATRTSELDATAETLATTQGDLEASTRDNRRLEGQLTRAQDAFEFTRRDLTTERATSAGLRAELGVLETSLDETQNSLSQSQRRVVLQAGSIDTLKACLSGVSTSLGYAAYELWDDAFNALVAVEVVCDRAAALF